MLFLSRPFDGTYGFSRLIPNVKALGYSHFSLREKEPPLLKRWAIVIHPFGMEL